MTTPVVVLGAGRAGGSFATALRGAGWPVTVVHHDDPLPPVTEPRLVLICVPDAALPGVAAALVPSDMQVVGHVAGSVGLGVLSDHPRVCAVHPLVSLPDPVVGAQRLHRAWFAVAGDPVATEVVEALGGSAVQVADADRAVYHAAAAVAANHLVALMGQVERLAESIGVPSQAFVDLATGALGNVEALGAAAALTGPVARGDWDTVARHLAALPADELPQYLADARAAARLAGREWPGGLGASSPDG